MSCARYFQCIINYYTSRSPVHSILFQSMVITALLILHQLNWCRTGVKCKRHLTFVYKLCKFLIIISGYGLSPLVIITVYIRPLIPIYFLNNSTLHRFFYCFHSSFCLFFVSSFFFFYFTHTFSTWYRISYTLLRHLLYNTPFTR